MWSGPRNISTALMRSWGSRPDTIVCDEPLYARYLARTGADHPGREEIVAAGQTDLSSIIDNLLAPLPPGKFIFYQKHMAHHLLPGDDTAWMSGLRNALLIRDPAEMIASYQRVVASPTARDLGLPQQLELLDAIEKQTGSAPPIIDARDVLTDPRGVLAALCAALGVAFDPCMLSWAPGPRETDGPWARYWYESVERSTGFEPYRPRTPEIPGRLSGVLAECRGIYERLHAARLPPTSAA
ncbi:MAG: HAD family hydrolase [Phycisphaeraceae bacterium]|nr:HAD family hydrolase [Phycisphaeraceae bacterium]